MLSGLGSVATSTGTFSSRSSRLMVGGATLSRSASMAATDSMAPAPPSRCPVIDLVDVTITPSMAVPSALASACASTASPSGVDVACALTCTT